MSHFGPVLHKRYSLVAQGAEVEAASGNWVFIWDYSLPSSVFDKLCPILARRASGFAVWKVFFTYFNSVPNYVYVQKRLGTVFILGTVLRHEFPTKKQIVILNRTKKYYQSISSFLFEYLFLAALVFTATRAFPPCGAWGLLSSCSAQASCVVASFVAQRGLHGTQASVAVVHGLQYLWLTGSRVQAQ